MNRFHFRFHACLAAILIGILFVAGCGGGKGGSDEEYMQAIKSYIAAKNMGMVVSSIQSSEVTGTGAIVVCKMKDAEGLYNLAVTWRFNMSRDGGAWKVVDHSTR